MELFLQRPFKNLLITRPISFVGRKNHISFDQPFLLLAVDYDKGWEAPVIKFFQFEI